MASTILTLLISIAVVFGAAVIFVNAIEYLGYRLHLGGSFVGAILAPLFTSFPEMIVFLVAVFAYPGEAGEEIGIGSIFGEPFVVSCLSYAFVGIVAVLGYLKKRRSAIILVVDKTLIIPYAFITTLFPLTAVPGVWPIVLLKYLFGFVFLSAYVIYIWLMYQRRKSEPLEEADEPYLCKVAPRNMSFPTGGAILQLMFAIIVLYLGAGAMVRSVDILAMSIGISALGLALIVVPAATAIPETSSALIWGYRGKDTLCIGSLVGEKILYSTFYPALGMFLTCWFLDIHAYLSVIATTVKSLIMLYFIAKQRLPWYGLYFGLFFFVMYAVAILGFRV